MNRVVIRSSTDNNGDLNLRLPLGAANARQEVQITIEPVSEFRSSADWQRAILSTAGKWQGEFERPPQDEYEGRESLL